MRYFTGDHLGSISVITDETGAVAERLSYDAWGKRRFANGQDDPTNSITSQTTRGFTDHEHISNVGLINMNARVYDPVIARFLSPDSFIQDYFNSQVLNRYTYVNNNPLSLTDPTGHFSLGKLWKSPIFRTVVVMAAILTFNVAIAGTVLANSIGLAAIEGAIQNIVVTGNLSSAWRGLGGHL